MMNDHVRGGWAVAWPMVTATVLWAGAFVAGKMSVGAFPPVSLTFLRFALASAIMVPVVLITGADWRFPRREWLTLLFLGLTGMVGYHLFFFEALRHTSTVNSAMLAATSPMATAILARTVGEERLSRAQAVATVLAVIGVLIIVTDGRLSRVGAIRFNRGDLAMFGSVLSMAVYSVTSRKSGLSRSPLGLVTWTFVICAAVTGPLTFLEGSLVAMGRGASSQAWWSVAYMALFASCGGYLLQMISIGRIGAARTMVFISLIPVFTTALAVTLLDESVSPAQIAGLVTVVSAVWINSKRT